MSNVHEAIAAIDLLNSSDPNMDEGKPKEWLYSVRMTHVLDEFRPTPSDLLQIAARAQHICRWQMPRTDFPEGRAGYHHWRKACQAMHVEKTVEVMKAAGYSSADQEAVAAMLRKEGLHSNPDVQTIEDVACLVFLKFYLVEFAAKHPQDKVGDILRKTWKKMSAAAHQSASTFYLPAKLVALIS